MKAVRIHQFGGPETLRVEDLPMPQPGHGEVRIRVIGASVNPVDYKMRNGGYLPREALPLTLGRDVAGAFGWMARTSRAITEVGRYDPFRALRVFRGSQHHMTAP